MTRPGRLRELIARSDAPVTRASVASGLRSLGLSAGDTVIVHSSLSALGWVNGGAVAVVQAMKDIVTPNGTIVTPAHSYNYSDPAGWTSPALPPEWWRIVRETMPAFDPELAPTTSMGQIVEVLRRWPDTVRTKHPVVSFCVWGRDAALIASRQTYEWAQGDTSPLQDVYERDGKVLLLGVGHDRNTSFHLAEYRVEATPKRRNLLPIPTPAESGAAARRVVWQKVDEIDFMDDEWLLALGAAFEQAHPVRVGVIGLAECRLFSQRAAVDFAEQWLTERYAEMRTAGRRS